MSSKRQDPHPFSLSALFCLTLLWQCEEHLVGILQLGSGWLWRTFADGMIRTSCFGALSLSLPFYAQGLLLLHSEEQSCTNLWLCATTLAM